MLQRHLLPLEIVTLSWRSAGKDLAIAIYGVLKIERTPDCSREIPRRASRLGMTSTAESLPGRAPLRCRCSGSNGNQLDGRVAFICWCAPPGGRAFLAPPAAHGQKFDGRELVEAKLLADTTAVVPGKPFTAGLLLKMAPGLAHLLGVSGRCRHPDRAEMGPAARLESRPDPVAHPAQAERTGRHPDLRLSRRSSAHDAAHPAVEDRSGIRQTRRRSQLARLRKNLHPGQRQSATWICPSARKTLPPIPSFSRNSATASRSRSRRARAAHYTGVVRRTSFG